MSVNGFLIFAILILVGYLIGDFTGAIIGGVIGLGIQLAANIIAASDWFARKMAHRNERAAMRDLLDRYR